MKEGLSYDDVLLVPTHSEVDSRSDVSLRTELSDNLTLHLPILSAPMDTVTGEEMATALGDELGAGIVHRYQSIENQADIVSNVRDKGLQVGGAVGIDEKHQGTNYLERAEALVDADVTFLCVDVAHGHLQKCLDAVERLSERFDGREVDIMAGNVATSEGAADLCEAGADMIRVGIGNGSHCTTRKKTGVGVPQVTALQEALEGVRKVRISHGLSGDDFMEPSVIADGGITCPGDAAKALMLGVDAVMIGGELSTREESAAEVDEVDFFSMGENKTTTRRYKKTRGQSRVGTGATEGVEKKRPISGTVSEFAEEYRQGLKSAVSYCGGENIKQARKNASFIKASSSTQDRNGEF